MTARNRVPRDQLRESWLFLLFGTEEETVSETAKSKLRYWECGVGNADRFVAAEAAQIGCGHVETESDLLTTLLSQLGQHRYQETVIITRSKASLQTLRRRIVENDTEVASLRGVSNICVEELLERYFDQTLANHQLDLDSLTAPRTTSESGSREVVTTGSVQEFWEVWKQIYQLLPVSELTGNEL